MSSCRRCTWSFCWPQARRATLGTAATCVIVLFGGLASVNQVHAVCRHERVESRRIDRPRDMQILRIQSASGRVVVRGTAQTETVRIGIRACASTPEQLHSIQVDATETAGRLEVSLDIGDRYWSDGTSVDLELEVPQEMAVDVTDGAGSLWVANVHELFVKDRTGEIAVAGVSNGAFVSDGAGSLRIGAVGGDLSIVDQAGSIVVSGVGGSVWIADGAGLLSVSQVEGDLTLWWKGSGKVRIANVKGVVATPEGPSPVASLPQPAKRSGKPHFTPLRGRSSGASWRASKVRHASR